MKRVSLTAIHAARRVVHSAGMRVRIREWRGWGQHEVPHSEQLQDFERLAARAAELAELCRGRILWLQRHG